MPTDTASFAHAGLGLSLLVPEDWEAEELSSDKVRFYAPASDELDGYRPTLSIAVGEPGGFGDDWFDALCDEQLDRLRAAHDGFELRDVQRYELSSLAPLNAIWFAWDLEPGIRSVQVQALILVDALRMFLINAATREPIDEATCQAFDAVLRSIRVLPQP